MIKRKLSQKGDLEQVLDYIEKVVFQIIFNKIFYYSVFHLNAQGIEKAKRVARIHHENALKVLRSLADSEI